MIFTGIVAASSLAITAYWPFAVVSDAVTAGIFSLVNTILNAIVIYMLTRTRQAAKQAAESAASAVDLTSKVARRTDYPRSRPMRETDDR